jgi:hypothetical protein
MEKQKDIKIERKTAFYFKSKTKGEKMSTDPTLTLLTILTGGTWAFNSPGDGVQKSFNQQ